MVYTRTMTRRQMEQRGWIFDPPTECKFCGETVSWGCNEETGKRATFNEPDSAVYHLKTCTHSGVRPASEIPQPQRDQHRRSAVRPLRDGPGRYDQRAPAARVAECVDDRAHAAATHSLQESLDDNSAALRALTAAILASMEARKIATATPAQRTDADGCPLGDPPRTAIPYDDYRGGKYK